MTLERLKCDLAVQLQELAVAEALAEAIRAKEASVRAEAIAYEETRFVDEADNAEAAVRQAEKELDAAVQRADELATAFRQAVEDAMHAETDAEEADRMVEAKAEAFEATRPGLALKLAEEQAALEGAKAALKLKVVAEAEAAKRARRAARSRTRVSGF